MHTSAPPGDAGGAHQPYYASGFQPKQLLTQFGDLRLRIPKTRNHGTKPPFHPYALERSRRYT